MKFSKIKALALVAAFHAFASHADEAWQPTRIDWLCQVAPTETLCSLSAIGPRPTMSYPGEILAKGWYRIFKGPVIGRGQVLMVKEATLKCVVSSSNMTCTAPNEVRFGPGIAAVSDPSPLAIDFNIYPTNGAITPLFDWNNDGAITANVEGLTVVRFLLGFRGDALVRGVPLSAGHTAYTVQEQLSVGTWNGWFQFGSTNNPRATNEGTILMRCLLGLRGAALIAGMPGYVSSTADSQCNLLLEKH